MSREELQAERLAAWLDAAGGPVPDDLDPDVIEGLIALRPKLAGPPSLTADDILEEVLEGPLAGLPKDALAAAALADWLDRGGPPPEHLDLDAIEGMVALRPELAPPPSLTAEDILAATRAGGPPAAPTAPGLPAPANNRRWFLTRAAGLSGVVAAAAAALFTIGVQLQNADQLEVAEAEAPAAAPLDEADKRRDGERSTADREKAEQQLQSARDAAPEKPAAAAEPEPRPTRQVTSRARPAQDPAPVPEELQLGGGRSQGMLGAEGMTGGEGMAGGAGLDLNSGGPTGGLLDAPPSASTRAPAPPPPVSGGRPSSPRPASPKKKQKTEPLKERFAPAPAAKRDDALTADASKAPMSAPEPEPTPDVAMTEAPAVADLDAELEEEDAFEEAPMEAYEDADDAGELAETTAIARSNRPRAERSRRELDLSFGRARSASNSAEAEASSVDELPPSGGDAGGDSTLLQLRADAAGQIRGVTRRAGTRADLTPPQSAGEPVAIHLADAAIARRDWETARVVIREGLSLGGENTAEKAWLWFLLGEVAWNTGDPTEAERAWREAIRVWSQRPAPSESDQMLMSEPP